MATVLFGYFTENHMLAPELLRNPIAIGGAISVAAGLLLLRLNARTWYEYRKEDRILFHRCEIIVPPWKGTMRTYQNAHHIAVR